MLNVDNVDMSTQAPTQVFIVDDVPLMRERLRELVDQLPEVTVVGDAGTPTEAIAAFSLRNQSACSSTISSWGAPEWTCCARFVRSRPAPSSWC